MKKSNVDSIRNFKSHWICWKVLGAAYDKVEYKVPYITYAILINIIVSVCYPLHLMMSALRNGSTSKDVKNLSMVATCAAASLKFFIYTKNMQHVQRVETLLRQLDARVQTEDELRVYQQIQKQIRNILIVFMLIYIPCGITAELSFIYQEERGLMYPAWFPFDWRNSTRNFYIANVYQVGGIFFQIIQNYVSDSFPTFVLCLISGHIRLLGLRLSRIGHDESQSLLENEQELERCIIDQQHLYTLFETLSKFMSLPMFIQFTVTAYNICISAAALLFFVTSPMDRLYFSFYLLAMPMEIFPTCYFGTDNEFMFGQLLYDAFSCNWISQSRGFKKNLIFFMERSLRKTTAMAGGMLRVHVDTFFSTLKGAYSLFAVILRMKN